MTDSEDEEVLFLEGTTMRVELDREGQAVVAVVGEIWLAEEDPVIMDKVAAGLAQKGEVRIVALGTVVVRK